MDIQNFADELLNDTIVLRQKIEGNTMIDWTKEDQEHLESIQYAINKTFPALEMDILKILDDKEETQ